MVICVAEKVEPYLLQPKNNEHVWNWHLPAEQGNRQTNDMEQNMDTNTFEHLVRSQNLYVLQDTRSTLGNAMVFHAKDHRGYTTDLAEAHLFTLKEANLQHADRTTDQPHRLGDMIVAAGLSVDINRKKQATQTLFQNEPE